MECKEKAQLLAAYQKATEHFAAAVTELHHNLGTSLKEEYERLQQSTEAARRYAEQTRQAWEKHSEAHRC